MAWTNNELEALAAASELSTERPPMPTPQEAKDEIFAAGAVAPRVTLEQIKKRIIGTVYGLGSDLCPEEGSNHPSLDLLTICILVLDNGFTVTGESAVVSAANFDAQKGRDIAYEKAIDKLWALEGYLMRDRLFRDWLAKQAKLETDNG